MNNEYSFLSWARKGIANSIGAAPPSVSRANITLNVLLNGQTIPQTVHLLGPQDVIGVNQNMIVRSEPRHWITDFEPNYMAFVEFYEEDFPWRYTPKRPISTAHLEPWIALVVLEESEFEADDKSFPLPSFKIIKDAKYLFPKPEQAWAWAHVHVNGKVQNAAELDNLLQKNADMAYSRLMSPRKLKPNKAYHAFVVPSFEAGRLAGLGQQEAADKPANFGLSSWGDKSAGAAFPYYHRWYFRTGDAGDFEYLLTLLEPRAADKDIGKRDMDVTKPNFDTVWNEKYIDTLGNEVPRNTLGIEGAIKSPTMKSDVWPPLSMPTDFQKDVQRLVNLPEELLKVSNTPTVSIPFYGNKHILEKTIAITNDPTKDKWLTELNRDPRNRAVAGLGTKVVQTHQERLMDTAWQQVKNIKELNQRINFTQFAMQTADRLYVRHFETVNVAQSIAWTQALHAKIRNSPITIRKAMTDSTLPTAAVSPTFRRMTRPQGVFMRRANNLGTQLTLDGLINGINEGRITATPPAPPLTNATDLGGFVGTKPDGNGIPDWLRRLILNTSIFWLILPFILLFLIGLIFKIMWLAVGALVIGVFLFFLIQYLKKQWAAEQLFYPQTATDNPFTPEVVDSLPPRPNFEILTDVTAPSVLPRPSLFQTGVDSPQAARFKTALKDFYTLAGQLPAVAPVRVALDLTAVRAKIYAAIRPTYAIPKRFLAYNDFYRGSIRPEIFEEIIVPVMDYPDFKEPMYVPLRDLGKEFMCPNINKIPPDTISLLVTNPPFIESYMVGLNHEMARELLWREYPSDQRGSYFRQFWDVRGTLPDAKLTAEQQTENSRDIPKIHTWGKRTPLGMHPNPTPLSTPTKIDEKIVLTIRSNLFKRYPNTVVFAQHAVWDADDPTKRVLDTSLEFNFNTEFDNKIIKTPRFSAEMPPDIKFFGFNLTIEEAKGKSSKAEGDAGWFFVIMERPGEPRFGMDEPKPNFFDTTKPAIGQWNELHWGYMVDTKVEYDDLDVLDLVALKQPSLTKTVVKNLPETDEEDVAESLEDKTHAWATDSANIAYITYQAPVKVAVHATEMLENLKAT